MAVPAEVFRLARRGARLLLASSGAFGLPHVDGAGPLRCLSEGRVGVRWWFCHRTLANLGENPQCSLVVWGPQDDEGYQLAGRVEAIREAGVLDGFGPEDPPLPQVEHELVLRVEQVLEFRGSPHADLPVARAGAPRA